MKTDAGVSASPTRDTTQLYNYNHDSFHIGFPTIGQVGEMRKASEGGSQTTGQPGRLTFDAVEAGATRRSVGNDGVQYLETHFLDHGILFRLVSISTSN